MRYLIKKDVGYAFSYMGTHGERIRKVTHERIMLYGFKTLEGAEKAIEREKKYGHPVKFSIVSFPVD